MQVPRVNKETSETWLPSLQNTLWLSPDIRILWCFWCDKFYLYALSPHITKDEYLSGKQ